jgi:hypothetical protein
VLKPIENAQRSAMLIAIHAFAAKLKAAGPDGRFGAKGRG